MTAIRPQGTLQQREQPYRSEPYRRHVARQPCLACGYAQPNEEGYICQAAHIGILGRGMKNHDYFTIPLCPPRLIDIAPNAILDYAGCHVQFDKNQRKFAREKWNCTLNELKLERFVVWQAWQRVVNAGNGT